MRRRPTTHPKHLPAMNERVFRFRFSRRVWMLSMVYLIAFALLAYALYRLYEGD